MLMCDERSERICHGFYRAFRVGRREGSRDMRREFLARKCRETLNSVFRSSVLSQLLVTFAGHETWGWQRGDLQLDKV
jgi:hypothetical protein